MLRGKLWLVKVFGEWLMYLGGFLHESLGVNRCGDEIVLFTDTKAV